jgi:hypothetical protein
MYMSYTREHLNYSFPFYLFNFFFSYLVLYVIQSYSTKDYIQNKMLIKE